MSSAACPFCAIAPEEILIACPLAIARHDLFPVSKGHTLIIPRRHVRSFFETTEDERRGMMALLDEAKGVIDREHRPDGYNVGINDGVAAGQTVMHVHMHLIPRYAGDSPDPRGGVRWVVPGQAAYWKKP
jgi:diadenosine tetraphosphate (Ap4A) HIT family hydrolase